MNLTKPVSQQLAAGVKVPQTPSFRLPVGASQEERKAAEAARKDNAKKGRNGR